MKIKVSSNALDTDYGGEQLVACERGEYILDEIFRLNFFRIIIDDVIGDSVCLRLMEGAEAHYFVLEPDDSVAHYSRETSLGYDDFTLELCDI